MLSWRAWLSSFCRKPTFWCQNLFPPSSCLCLLPSTFYKPFQKPPGIWPPHALQESHDVTLDHKSQVCFVSARSLGNADGGWTVAVMPTQSRGPCLPCAAASAAECQPPHEERKSSERPYRHPRSCLPAPGNLRLRHLLRQRWVFAFNSPQWASLPLVCPITF